MSYESSEIPIYKLAPTTHRNAELLAKRHHFDNLHSLMESLPERAQILDVGAGLSNLGATVAASRSDIQWTNFDYSYNDLSILEKAQQYAPNNVRFVAGDAINLTETYQDETFDAVFSYWMFPHLSIDSRLPAERVAREIFRVAKQGALISVGPKTDKHLFPLMHEKKSIRVHKDSMIDEDEFVEEVVVDTKLGPLMRYISRIDNVVGTKTVGTTAGIQGGGLVPHIYDQEKDVYVSPFSRRGARVIGRVALATGHYVTKNPPF